MYRPKSKISSQSSKFLREKKRKNIFIGGLIAVALLTWVTALSNFTYLKSFTIRSIIISGADDDIKNGIRATTMGVLDGSYLKLFAKANSFIYPKDQIEQKLLESSERIKNVSVSRKGLQALVINIEEKSPAALICTNLPDWNGYSLNLEEDECYFSDAKAFIYKRAPSISGHMYNRYYISDFQTTASTSGPVVGSTAMPLDMFNRLQKFYDDVEAYEIIPAGALINSAGEYELYVYNPEPKFATKSFATSTTTPGQTMTVVYFNERNGLDTQLGNLVSFWSNAVTKANSKKEILRFDSIDLRYGSNVFYRSATE